MTRHALALAAATLFSLAAVPAVAQDDIVKLNEEGITAFSEGRFEEAATKFRKAYELKPEQTLKKNEAIAWFKASMCTEALRAADEYLALEPSDELSVKETKTVIVRCNVQSAETAAGEQKFDEAEKLLAVAEANDPGEEDAARIEKVRVAIAAERQKVADAKAAEARKAEEEKQRQAEMAAQSRNQTIGLAMMSAGGALVVGTLGYHLAMALGTAPKFKDVAAAGDDLAEYNRLSGKLETANWLIPTLYAVGLGVSGVGAYFWWSSGGLDSDPDAAAAGAATNDKSVGVTLMWRF